MELHLRRGGRRGHARVRSAGAGVPFCPAGVVTRRSMAGFIERAAHGALTPPPVYLGEFGDVTLGSFNANYIRAWWKTRSRPARRLPTALLPGEAR